MWNERDGVTELRDAHDDEDHAGHERGDGEAIDTVLLHDAVDDHDECAGGSADLHARSAQQRDQEAGDDGCPEAATG